MAAHTTHSSAKKWLLFLSSGTLVLLFVIALTLRLLVANDWVLNQASQWMLERVNKDLNGSVSITSVEGDLWDHLLIREIKILDEQQEILLHVDTLRLNYRLMDVLFPAHTLYSLQLKGVHINAYLQNDTWNFERLTTPDTSAVKSEFSLPAFQLSNVDLQRFSLKANAPGILPGDELEIKDLNLRFLLALDGSELDFNLRQFNLLAESPLLPEPVHLVTRALATSNDVLIKDFRLQTGSSVLLAESRLTIDADTANSKVDAQVKLLPFHPKDFGALLPAEFPQQPLESELHLHGKLGASMLELSLNTAGIEGFKSSAELMLWPNPVLQNLALAWDQLRLNQLLSNKDLPEFGPFGLSLNGEVPLDDLSQSRATTVIQLLEIQYAPYHLNRVQFNADINAGKGTATLNLQKGRQTISAEMNFMEVWSLPVWKVSVNAKQLDLGYWAANEDLKIRSDLQFVAEGKDFALTDAPISWQSVLKNVQIEDQPIKEIASAGLLDQSRIDANTIVSLEKSKLQLGSGFVFGQERPEYSLNVFTRGFNLAELKGLEAFPSSLYFNAESKAEGLSLNELRLTAQFSADSSIINRQRIDRFSSQIVIEDTVLYVVNGDLRSSIAEGRLEVRQHLRSLNDPLNNLSYSLRLKDISVFRPLLNAQNLLATGSIEGKMALEGEELTFRNQIRLRDLFYDSLSIKAIEGSAVIHLTDSPKYSLKLDVRQPAFNTIALQSFVTETSGNLQNNDHLIGQFKVDLSVRNEEGIKPEGSYFITPDSTQVVFNKFDFITSKRRFSATNPFSLRLYGNDLQLDTLQLRSTDDAQLDLSADVLQGKTHVYFRSKDFDVGAFQRSFIEIPFVEGILSGELDLNLVEDNLGLNASFSFVDLGHQQARMDSLSLRARIQDHRLRLNLFVRDSGLDILTTSADLPFRLGDPTQFPDTFFEEPVKGELWLYPTSLSVWRRILLMAGLEETGGILSMRGQLSGTAGAPNMSGRLLLSNANLSGVLLDSVRLGFSYKHDDRRILVDSKINKLGVRIADLNASLPFHIDFRTYEMELPSPDSNISARLNTNKLELASFNEFLDPATLRNLQGLLSMNLDVKGTIGSPVAEGFLRLDQGSVRIVPANIRLQQAYANLIFEPGRINVDAIRFVSGGEMRLNGLVQLPRDASPVFDLQLNGNRTRLSNTRDLQVAISPKLNIKGTLIQPKVDGTIKIDEANIYLDKFGTRSVEAVSIEELEGITVQETPSLFDAMTMNVKIEMLRNVWVRNRESPELQLELEGDLSLEKERDKELQLFGEVNTRRGHATQFGKRFNLEKGNIVFNGDPSNPLFEIRTLYTIRQNDINIWFIIKGTLDEPEFTFESDPPMELENIVSYILFGRPFNALFAWQQNIAGNSSGNSAAADAAIGILLDRVEALATEKIGLDVIEIDNSGNSGSSGTTIRAGKYLNDRVFLAIQQQISDRNVSMVMINYLLRKNLELIMTQSNDNRSGVDIEWRRDY